MTCGECGSKNVTLQNVNGRIIRSQKLVVDLILHVCGDCGNIIPKAGDGKLIDEAIERSETKALLNILHPEVLQMANKGLYTLFISKDRETLIAKDEEHVFYFSTSTGACLKTTEASSFNSSLFKRISLINLENPQKDPQSPA